MKEVRHFLRMRTRGPDARLPKGIVHMTLGFPLPPPAAHFAKDYDNDSPI